MNNSVRLLYSHIETIAWMPMMKVRRVCVQWLIEIIIYIILNINVNIPIKIEIYGLV